MIEIQDTGSTHCRTLYTNETIPANEMTLAMEEIDEN